MGNNITSNQCAQVMQEHKLVRKTVHTIAEAKAKKKVDTGLSQNNTPRTGPGK